MRDPLSTKNFTTNHDRRKEGWQNAAIHAGVQWLGGSASAVFDVATDASKNKIDDNKYFRPVLKSVLSAVIQRWGGAPGWSFGAAWTGDTAGSTIRRIGDLHAQNAIDEAVKEQAKK